MNHARHKPSIKTCHIAHNRFFIHHPARIDNEGVTTRLKNTCGIVVLRRSYRRHIDKQHRRRTQYRTMDRVVHNDMQVARAACWNQ